MQKLITIIAFFEKIIHILAIPIYLTISIRVFLILGVDVLEIDSEYRLDEVFPSIRYGIIPFQEFSFNIIYVHIA